MREEAQLSVIGADGVSGHGTWAFSNVVLAEYSLHDPCKNLATRYCHWSFLITFL